MINIDLSCEFLDSDEIARIEKAYNTKYVCETCIRTKSVSWTNFPCAIFYTEEAHPEGSNYMSIFLGSRGTIVIADGISATEPFTGLQVGNDVIYSHYRHDYRVLHGMFIDGGRDYVRYGGHSGNTYDDPGSYKLVTLAIVKDKLEIVEK